MDPQCRAQDAVRCYICERSFPSMHCDACNVCLCKSCVGEHLSDLSKSHKVVPFEQRNATPNYPRCTKHTTRQCELHCKQCDIPICVQCASSKCHRGHKFVDMLKNLKSKQKALQKDLDELERSLYHNYQTFASTIQIKITDIQETAKIMATDIDAQGKVWHREIDVIMKHLKSEVKKIESKQMVVLNKQQEETNQIMDEIEQTILDLKKALDSNDINFVYAYRSRNNEFREMPPDHSLSLPRFIPENIDTKQLQEQFGSLSMMPDLTYENEFAIKTKVSDDDSIYENDSTVKTTDAENSLLDEPKMIVARNIGTGTLNTAVCLNDELIWTTGQSSIIKLYNLQGELLSSIHTMSGNWPWDITITKSGDLFYTDPQNRTVNKTKNDQIWTLPIVKGWVPRSICSTLTDDVLVLSVRHDDKQTQVVRYTGSSKTQTIQFNENGQPLYSPGCYKKIICENRNMDICVSDYGAGAVVVVNQTGILRFTYRGYQCTTKASFFPSGIATDGKGRILTADSIEQRIHILDQDGQFLRYVEHKDLHFPRVLCISKGGTLFVTEWEGKIFS